MVSVTLEVDYTEVHILKRYFPPLPSEIVSGQLKLSGQMVLKSEASGCILFLLPSGHGSHPDHTLLSAATGHY